MDILQDIGADEEPLAEPAQDKQHWQQVSIPSVQTHYIDSKVHAGHLELAINTF